MTDETNHSTLAHEGTTVCNKNTIKTTTGRDILVINILSLLNSHITLNGNAIYYALPPMVWRTIVQNPRHTALAVANLA